MAFQDHFSQHAAVYASARPDYPQSLYAFLKESCAAHEKAWDCATGNGQAAVELAKIFTNVVASDGSAEQIEQAPKVANIEYYQAPAEGRFLEADSCDLITVAQALHWFDTDAFFENVRHCLKPQGVLAVWSYGIHRINNDVDSVIARLYGEILQAYWPPERRLVENGYRDIEFPFPTRSVEGFAMTREWNLYQVCAYIRSWSALQRYLKAKGVDPLQQIEEDLLEAWGGDPEERFFIEWPLTVIVARV